MNRFRYGWMLAAAFVMAIGSPRILLAQPDTQPSHKFFDNDVKMPSDIGHFLKSDKAQQEMREKDNQLLENLLKTRALDHYLESMFHNSEKIDPKTDRMLQQRYQEFLKQHPDLKNTETINRLQELIRQQNAGQGGNLPEQLQNVEKAFEELKRRNEKAASQHAPEHTVAKHPSTTPEPPKPPEPGEPKTDPKLPGPTEDFGKWAANTLGDDFLKGVGDAFLKSNEDAGNSSGFGNPGDEWDKLGKGLQLNWSGNAFDGLSGWKLPDLSLGGSSGGHGSSESSGGSSSSSWSGSNSSGSGSGTVIGMVCCAIAGILAAVLLIRYLRNRVPALDLSQQLTPIRGWPVDPSSITSRAEVVKTFEYLSVRVFGEDACHWHHHEIAGRIGRRGPEQREAAGGVAAVYEKARYAPLDESLTATEINAFRHGITHLAGGMA